eukprot:1957176-Pyramimonas_sp.AAC.1
MAYTARKSPLTSVLWRVVAVETSSRGFSNFENDVDIDERWQLGGDFPSHHKDSKRPKNNKYLLSQLFKTPLAFHTSPPPSLEVPDAVHSVSREISYGMCVILALRVLTISPISSIKAESTSLCPYIVNQVLRERFEPRSRVQNNASSPTLRRDFRAMPSSRTPNKCRRCSL